LAKDVAAEAAAYAVHIESRDGFYRVLRIKCPTKGVIEIPADDISGTIEITGFIVAQRESATYVLDGAHADYRDTTFSIRPGDVLACSRTSTFEAEKEFDPLKKVSSIMQILPADDIDGPFTVDFAPGKISVFLSKSDYELYGEARNDTRLASSLIQGIVLPVLVAAIADAARQKESAQPLPRWAEIIRQRLAAMRMDIELGLDPEKALNVAQVILQQPTHRFLSDIIKISEGEGDEPQVSD
jgi:hypothetical protein